MLRSANYQQFKRYHLCLFLWSLMKISNECKKKWEKLSQGYRLESILTVQLFSTVVTYTCTYKVC